MKDNVIACKLAYMGPRISAKTQQKIAGFREYEGNARAGIVAYMNLKDRVRTARKHAELSQEELAKRIGISRVAITQWENGTVKALDASNAIRAARELGVDELWFATGEGNIYGVRDEEYKVPPALTRAWQHLDKHMRECLLKLAEALAAKK